MQFNNQQFNMPPVAPAQFNLPFTAHATPEECGEALMASKFKTSLCRTYQETGYCTYEHRCMFAHGQEDLRTKEQNMADGLTSDTAIRNYQRQAATAEAQRTMPALRIPLPPTGSSPSSPVTNASSHAGNNSPWNSLPVTPAHQACSADNCAQFPPQPISAGSSAATTAFAPPQMIPDAPRPFRYLDGVSKQHAGLSASTTASSMPTSPQWQAYKDQEHEDSLAAPSHGSSSSTTGPTPQSSERASSRRSSGDATNGHSDMMRLVASPAYDMAPAAPQPAGVILCPPANQQRGVSKGRGPRHMTPKEQAQGYHSNSPYTPWEYNPQCKCRDCVVEWCARF